ncbi:hypothetical protein EBR04_01410 [bacterium]|nr:hypothetical protein [bacterium]
MMFLQVWQREHQHLKGLPMTTYNVKIRFKGSISYVTVNANSEGQAKQLVLAQYGGQVDVLSVSRA